MPSCKLSKWMLSSRRRMQRPYLLDFGRVALVLGLLQVLLCLLVQPLHGVRPTAGMWDKSEWEVVQVMMTTRCNQLEMSMKTCCRSMKSD